MCSGRSGVQKHGGRACLLCLALDAGGQHGANLFGRVAVESGDAVHDLQDSLNNKNMTESILGTAIL